MNLNKLIFFFIILFSLNLQAQDNHLKYAPIQNIINHLFDNYQTLNNSENVKFEKRPDGYFLKFTNDTSFNEKIWDYETEKYQKLSLKISTNSQNQLRDSLLNFYLTPHYNFIPFYGYDEDSYDVVQKYKANFEQYPDSIVYGIARSYSSYAISMIGMSNDQFSKKLDYQFDIKYGPNALNNSQLKSFLLYANKALDLFKLVKVKNPNFQTVIGNINLKIWNEYVDIYYRLSLIQNENEALKFLPSDLYDPFMLAYAKNCLSNCDSNAILFTNGDSDTYPLWYLQAKYGFRKDVYVLNLSLLNTYYYIEGLSRGILSYRPLNFGFPFKLENNFDDFYLYSNNKCDEKVELIDFLKDVSFENIGKKVNTCFVKGNLKWKFERYYLVFQDIAILSLIDKYFGVKPINFAITIPHNSYLGLYDFFSNSAITYKLTYSLEEEELTIMENRTKRLEFLLQKLDTSGFKLADSNYKYSQLKSNYANAYFRAFIDCYKETEQIEQLVKKMMSIFPKNKPYLIPWIIVFNVFGYENEAEDITQNLLICYNFDLNLKNNLDEWDYYIDYLKEYANESEANLKIYKRFEEINK